MDQASDSKPERFALKLVGFAADAAAPDNPDCGRYMMEGLQSVVRAWLSLEQVQGPAFVV